MPGLIDDEEDIPEVPALDRFRARLLDGTVKAIADLQVGDVYQQIDVHGQPILFENMEWGTATTHGTMEPAYYARVVDNPVPNTIEGAGWMVEIEFVLPRGRLN